MWLIDTGDWAGKVLCSITQWCGKPWLELAKTKMNTQANKILVGRTLELLHDYGVTHGNIGYETDLRHASRTAARCAPVCGRAGRDEMVNVTVTYMLGFMPKDLDRLSPNSETYKAIQWHNGYSKRHPDWPNGDVLIAQRAKLFDGMPPLYPGFYVTFEGDEEFSTAILAREIVSDEETCELVKKDADRAFWED
ncbi:hypothetical protein C8R43DRAFT_1199100 [Mycena crocata]|nr:hypothetical protein C8R43DRAFT_1199100 [Mycena crocata]